MSHNGPSAQSAPVQSFAIHVLPSTPSPASDDRAVPSLYGLPLKYLSLVTLAVQNAALTIIMHTSRISTSPAHQYSASSAVLLNELLKGAISLAIAFARVDVPPVQTPYTPKRVSGFYVHSSPSFLSRTSARIVRVLREIFSPDCWKLSIPATLYVIQNNLQYVAASNLDAATFQVTYQMKILTTAAFSVLLLRKQLTSTKWLALLFLAIGVGIVQIQSGTGETSPDAHAHHMNPLLGFLAVTAACFTSGLAGVYFEMVLKNSQADLWVRNVQLSLFSLAPALLPAILAARTGTHTTLFHNFGGWAWATVLTQVFGGLITAVVIKHADNILKGFATSLSIVLSFAASVALFDFTVTPAFLVGALVVLCSTWMYNQPAGAGAGAAPAPDARAKPPSVLGSPVAPSAPILGHTPNEKKRISARAIAAALGLPTAAPEDRENEPIVHPLYTPPSTRPSSPAPSRPPSRLAATPVYTLSRAGSGASLDVVASQGVR